LKLKFGKSSVLVTIEDEEDMYVLFRFLKPGDIVGSKTTRRIKQEETGTKSTRQQVYLEICVEKVAFFGFSEALRISGKITQSSEKSISLNTYHSIKIGLHQQLSISTMERDSSEFEVLKERLVGDETGRVAVIIDDDNASIYKIGSRATKLLLELEPSITRKSSDATQHEQGILEYYDTILSFLLDFTRQSNIDSLIVAGPGFTKDGFFDFLKERSIKMSKLVILVDLKGTGERGLLELLKGHLKDIPVGIEAGLMQVALENLAKGNDKTMYGLNEIQQLTTSGAIEYLLILDEKLYESVEERELIDRLSSEVRNFGGKVYFLSSLQPSADVIRGFGGIIALLRYSVQI